jgi:hypothetical protein
LRLVNLSNLPQFTAVNLTADPGYDRGNRVIPACAQIRLSWFQEDGVIANNVLHASYVGLFAGTITQANAILTGLGTGPQWTALATFLATSTVLVQCTIRDLAVEHAPEISSNISGFPGTSPSSAMPNEVAAVLTLRTQFTGPQFRGRVFVPGWATNALGTGNVIAAGAMTDLNAWGSIIAGVLAAQGYTFGIGHFHRLEYTSASGTHHDERPAGVEPIANVVVRDNHWDTIRRRGLK